MYLQVYISTARAKHPTQTRGSFDFNPNKWNLFLLIGNNSIIPIGVSISNNKWLKYPNKKEMINICIYILEISIFSVKNRLKIEIINKKNGVCKTPLCPNVVSIIFDVIRVLFEILEPLLSMSGARAPSPPAKAPIAIKGKAPSVPEISNAEEIPVTVPTNLWQLPFICIW